MEISTTQDFDTALANGPYAWPGGYPLYFITDDGAALSFKAASDNADLIRDELAKDMRGTGWRVVAMSVNWEDTTLVCAHTGEPIESAYGE